MNKMILLLLSVVCASCTTLNDFQAMSPNQRVELVCNSQADVKALRKQDLQAEQTITELSQVLAQGYQLVTTCKTIDSETWERSACKPYKDYKIVDVSCPLEKKMTQKRVCEEQVVDIHPELIKDQLRQQKQLQAEIVRLHDDKKNQCRKDVAELPVEAAYQRYVQFR